MKISFLLSLLLITLYSASIKNKIYNNALVLEVTSIYDGDTFRVIIENYPDVIGLRIPIRVNGIDTPELRATCKRERLLAYKAKELTVSTLRTAKNIELRNIRRGKYFRLIADVYVDNKNLAQLLLDAKLAVAYDVRKNKDWCKE